MPDEPLSADQEQPTPSGNLPDVESGAEASDEPIADTGDGTIDESLPESDAAPAEAASGEEPVAETTSSPEPSDVADEAAEADASSAETSDAPMDDTEAAMMAMLDVAGDEGTPAAAANEVEAAMQAMLDGAGESAAQSPPTDPAADASPFEPPDFSSPAGVADGAKIELLDDVELEVKIELGRTEMYIEDVLALGRGSVVELNKAAGDPVDVFVNDRLVARGEVLVLNEDFCVRINDILNPVPEPDDNR